MQSYLPILLTLVIVTVIVCVFLLLKRARPELDLASTPEPSDKVKALAQRSDSKIEAIKAYREQTGADLKVAKAVVERLAANDLGDR